MKVTLPKDWKKRFTYADMEIAREMIADLKEDESTVADYAAQAAYHYMWQTYSTGTSTKVYEASATIAKNGKKWNAYSDHSDDIDVWIRAVVEVDNGFLKIGVYLTDLWSIGGDVDITPEMYVEYYRRGIE